MARRDARANDEPPMTERTRALTDQLALAAAIRTACVEAALQAYDDAGIQGLCEEGRWECAITAVRRLDLQTLIAARAADAEPARMLRVKRVADSPAEGDGARILVDRLWPRGLSRATVALDAWLPEVAPSTALRRWCGHQPSRWPEFERRYARELDAAPDAVQALMDRVLAGPVTLLSGARDEAHNHAATLRRYLLARIG
jgi:uncharacterized protein YeaO (DUF488 family)